ncbi:lytic murein transglycosylase [bacterium]|nr:lytic murein transglycosylase [bacterium]
MNLFKKTILLSLLLSVTPIFQVSAAYDMGAMCDSGKWETECKQISKEECEKLCNDCLTYLNEKGKKIQAEISETGSKKKTLQNQVNSLNKRLKDLENQISQSKIAIKVFGDQIEDTSKSIDETTVSISGQQQKIADILRAAKQEDEKSFFEILVTSNSLADFFDDMLYMETLGQKNKDILENLESLNTSLIDKKSTLEEQTDQLKNLVIIQGEQKAETDIVKKERQEYLNSTEKEYQAKLAEKKDLDAKAAKISSALFELADTEGGGIAFGEAAKLAKFAEKATGVKAALILAIIHQESFRNGLYGGNVGQCYLTDFNTGNGTSLSGAYKARVMSPTRDVPVFLDIVKAIGKDPKKTPVSCWIPMYTSGKPYGWGGAMGPAQFIASTWKLVRSDVDSILGKAANPWAIKDAFLASAVLLKKNGGISDPYTAACRYYAGQCNTAGKGYANSVTTRMKQYQQDLDILVEAGILK